MASSVVVGTTSSQGRPQRTKKKQFTLYEPIYVIWPNGKNYPGYITKIIADGATFGVVMDETKDSAACYSNEVRPKYLKKRPNGTPYDQSKYQDMKDDVPPDMKGATPKTERKRKRSKSKMKIKQEKDIKLFSMKKPKVKKKKKKKLRSNTEKKTAFEDMATLLVNKNKLLKLRENQKPSQSTNKEEIRLKELLETAKARLESRMNAKRTKKLKSPTVSSSSSEVNDKPNFHHINSFLKTPPGEKGSGKNINVGFGSFIREKLVTVGFFSLHDVLGTSSPGGIGAFLDNAKKLVQEQASHVPGATQFVIRDALKMMAPDHDMSDCRQVATWLTNVKKGDYIIVRHNNRDKTTAQMHYTPEKLKTLNNGSYSPVFALMKVVSPPNECDDNGQMKNVAKKLYEESRSIKLPYHFKNYNNNNGNGWGMHAAYARVELIGMGLIEDLRHDTRKYLTAVCQPTLSTFRRKMGGNGGKFTNSMEKDFINTAKKFALKSDDFPEFIIISKNDLKKKHQ